MNANRIVVVWCVVAGSAVFVAAAEPETGVTSGPPEINVAVMIDGRTLELRRFAVRFVTRTTTTPLPPGAKVEVKSGTIVPTSTTEVVPVVETQWMRYDIATVAARRVDGRAVAPKALVDELARPVPVILGNRSQPLDPIFAKLFKPETLVLTVAIQSPTTPFFTVPSVNKAK